MRTVPSGKTGSERGPFLNERWKYYLEEEYQKEAHDGIKEYYEAMDVSVPTGGMRYLYDFIHYKEL